MTSKRLFFKVMKEDLRHRRWMIALSVLASFLMFPVVWMLFRFNINMKLLSLEDSDIRLAVTVRDLVRGNIVVGGGAIALCGALTAALVGFGFLFHKNQTDSWHSLPVKRDMLFGAGYLNGILIWLLPLAAGMTLTGSMAGSFLTKYAGGVGAGEIPWMLVKELSLLTVIFLLTYNLILTAMMLSGNMLNTVVGALIMGFGGAGIYTLSLMLCQGYLETYFAVDAATVKWAIYASPFLSPIALLVYEVSDAGVLLINLTIAIVLGLAAWFLYRKRPSELAEQGIGSKAVSTVVRILTSVAAGVGGWLFFGALTDMRSVSTFFGAVLTGVLVFGILDVVFQMEFKAFFSHKLQMAAAVAAALVICLVFRGGLFGYDIYLPDREEIAELGLCRLQHFYQLNGEKSVLDVMKLQNQDAIYAFLQRATQWEGSRFRGAAFCVRVTLKNGKTYYRVYNVDRKDKDVLWPLLTDEEYLRCVVMLGGDVTESESVRIVLSRRDGLREEMELTKEDRERFVEAYNQDVLENVDALLSAEGRALTKIYMYAEQRGGHIGDHELIVYDFMENTVRQLRQMGCGEFVDLPESSKIQSLSLALGGSVRRDATAESLIRAAREYYLGEEAAKEGESPQEESAQATGDYPMVDTGAVDDGAYEPSIVISDRAEIEEILQRCSYVPPSNYDVFERQFHTVKVTGTDGGTAAFYIGEGDLPEKYILRFGELTVGK